MGDEHGTRATGATVTLRGTLSAGRFSHHGRPARADEGNADGSGAFAMLIELEDRIPEARRNQMKTRIALALLFPRRYCRGSGGGGGGRQDAPTP